MTSLTSCAQSELKNGVYEFTFQTIDTVKGGLIPFPNKKVTSSRTLIVKNDTILYKIENIDKTIMYEGTRENYYLQLEKKSDSLYKAENENIELYITIMNRNTVEIEVVKGHIQYFYSGGFAWGETRILPPEKQTLTFERELTPEDEENLSREREKIENKIIPEKS